MTAKATASLLFTRISNEMLGKVETPELHTEDKPMRTEQAPTTAQVHPPM